MTREPEADVFLQTASFLDQKDNKVCAEVRGLAVQIVDIQTIRNITKNDLNLYKQDTKDTGNKK